VPHLWLFGRTVRHPVRKPKRATHHETQGDSIRTIVTTSMGLAHAFADAREAMDAHKGNYFYEPIPIQLDTTLQLVVREFMTADEGDRAGVLSQLTPRYRQLLVSLGSRLAILGARRRNPDLITEGLIALRLGWPEEDSRDQIRDLAPMYHAALRAGADPAELFRSAAGIARDNDFTSFLEEFVSRPDDENSLEALGWREVDHTDGFRFEPGHDW
jgi:hypothetical protein